MFTLRVTHVQEGKTASAPAVAILRRSPCQTYATTSQHSHRCLIPDHPTIILLLGRWWISCLTLMASRLVTRSLFVCMGDLVSTLASTFVLLSTHPLPSIHSRPTESRASAGAGNMSVCLAGAVFASGNESILLIYWLGKHLRRQTSDEVASAGTKVQTCCVH